MAKSYEKNPVKIFILEDDPTYKKFLEYVLSLNPDFDVKSFETGKECLESLHEKPTIITLDYTLPDLKGEEVLDGILDFDPNIHVIIVSAQEKIGTAINLLKQGAYDYITKDEDTKDKLLNSINNARRNVSLVKEIDHLRTEISGKYEFDKIIGTSDAIKNVFSMLEKAAKTNIIVSLTGETGTGKELAAKAIHYNSSRKSKKFVAINIAAIPKELIESELFGHEKGAFTGASTRRIGKFEEAQEGTLFLDEIAEMDINLQAKLLRVLQERELTRVGGNDLIKLDVRIIVSTHKNLAEEVKNNRFREDLYYRLLGLPIFLPPLRDRGNDIIIIGKFLLDQFVRENHLDKLPIDNDAQEKLLKYNYPGNIRELKSIVELAAIMTNNNVIEADDIKFNAVKKENNLIFEELTMKEYEYRIVTHFLDKYDKNVLAVAKKLDIGKSTIYRYLKEM